MRYILDTNVMLLFVVGSADERMIETHKRVSNRFIRRNYKQLLSIIEATENLATTSNILTEVSNLLRQTDNRKRERLVSVFARIIESIPEIFLKSDTVVNDNYFHRLGLTDSIILKLKADDYHILSIDGPLCWACSDEGLPHTNLTPLFTDQ